MEKPTIPIVYSLGDNKVEILPYFLYEVSIYKITRDMVALKDSQYYKSDKALTIKNSTTIKRYRNYSIVRYVDVLGVTKEFVEENNLPIKQKKK